MTNRYAEDLKRIIGVKDTKGTLTEKEAREQILASRGIGYIDSNGTTQGQSGGSGTVRKPDSENTELNPLDKSALDETNPDEALAGEPPPGTGNGGEVGANSYSADALLAKDAGTPGLSATVDAFGDIINNKGYVTEITGVDCSTGDDVVISMLDDWTPPDATYYPDGSTKTEQWENASTPPEIVGYQDTYYWELAGTGNPSPEQGATATQAGEAGIAYLDANPPGGRTAPFTVTGLNPFGGSPATSYNVEYEGATGGSFTLVASRVSCSGTPPDSGDSCPASAPTESAWPVDGQVTYKKSPVGTFTTSQYDSEAPTGSNNGLGAVNFCGSTSGDPMTLAAGLNGTSLLYMTDGEGGPMLADTVAVILDSNNTIIGYTDVTGLSSYALR